MKELNILYLTDNNYAIFAGVSILSLFDNNKGIERLTVYVIDDNIAQENKNLYLKIAADYQREIIFLDMSDGIRKLENLGAPKYRGSYTTYLKLFAFNMIAQYADRLFFIDSDSIVSGSLEALDEVDLQGNTIAAVIDGLSAHDKKSLGYPDNCEWYNMGVLLIDLKKWMDTDGENLVLKQLKKRSAYTSVDQDILNITQHGNIIPLDLRYNITPHMAIYDIEKFVKHMQPGGKFYSKIDLQQALSDPAIHHFERFIGESPWHANNVHPFTPYFDHFLALSPWRDYVKKKASVSGVLKAEKILYKMLPHACFLPIYAKGMAWYFKKSNQKMENNQIGDNISL